MTNRNQHNATDVWRNELKEGRTDYLVTYQPADSRFPFASLDLVFPASEFKDTAVAEAMESEFEIWLNRYPVPLMVSAFDAREGLICIRNSSTESHLMGFRDLETGNVVRRWGVFENDELPLEQLTSQHLERIYDDIPSGNAAVERETARRKNRNFVRAGRAFIFFVVAVPVMIEVLSLGIGWLGWLLSAVSIGAGIRGVAKALGWLKPTEREEAAAEDERKKSHYYWHCERNPEAFMRLKLQNFEREATERTLKEAEALGVKQLPSSAAGFSSPATCLPSGKRPTSGHER